MFSKINLIVLAGIGLAACNSTVSTSGPSDPTIQALVESGEGASFSNAMSILVRDENGGTVVSGDRQDVSVTTTKNDAGDVILNLTALGRTVSFAPSDLSASGTEYQKTLADGTKVFLWTYDGTWEEVQKGDGKFKYMVRFGTSDVVNGVNTRGYGVMGTKTTAAQLPTSGSAVYSAEKGMVLNLYPTTDPDGKISMAGDVELNMDFANSQISGEFKNLVYSDGQAETSIFKVNPASVNNGSFSTTLTSQGGGTESPTLTSSSVNGAFFGAEAQEVGGDLSFSASSNGANYVAAGVFGATKQ